MSLNDVDAVQNVEMCRIHRGNRRQQPNQNHLQFTVGRFEKKAELYF